MRLLSSFLLCLAFQTVGSAEDLGKKFFEFQAVRQGGLPSAPVAAFAPKEATSFIPQIPKVNVITGEYCEEECDLLVAGSQPLSINRFYSHFSGIHHQLLGHWRINPEAYLLFNFEPVEGSQTFAAVGEANSSFFIYEQPCSNGFQIDAGKNRCFTNTSSLQSGKNHPLNTKVAYTKCNTTRHYPKGSRLAEDHCWWEGKIKDGSGRERIFKTDVKQWPQAGKTWPCKSKQHPISGQISKQYLEFIPPFQGHITEERLANGNVIHYAYEDIHANDHLFDRDLPTQYVLKSIKAYSQKGTLLGALECTYHGGFHTDRSPSLWYDRIEFVGSDGRKATLYNQQRRVDSKRQFFDTILETVDAPGKPKNSYSYRWDHHDRYYNMPFMDQAGSGGKCLLQTVYDSNTKKVVAQLAPVGLNGQVEPIARYEYHEDHTVFFDAENNKTIYRFNGDKRMVAVEKYQGDALYSVEKNEWESATGNLMRKLVEDATGHLIAVSEYAYDQNHNPKAQRVSHTLNHQYGGDCIFRTFSNDGLNLKLSESDRPGKEVQFTYIPESNLLTSEITYHNGKICKRVFYFYDDAIGSVRTKTLIDDGKSVHPDDLTGISFRKVIEVSPKRTLPCIGLPEEICEKTLDATGQEVLLKKVRYRYHPSGKITQEDHYDAHGAYRYSISREYDDHERLSATTDPLGHKTSYTYDAEFNLRSQSGPRADVHKEWVYDAVNRPIFEKEWQTGGSILTTEKRYDKGGKVTATIDPSGFETRYDYDALGRVVLIHYPDGVSEGKTYDILGNVSQEIDGNGEITKTIHNFRSQPTVIYHPDGTEERFTYNDHSATLAIHVNPQGVKTVYTYDLFDNPIQVDTYSIEGTLVTTKAATYSPFTKISETDEEGITTYYTYDFAGRKTAEKKGDRLTTYFYDELGRLGSLKENGVTTLFDYDLKGQLTEKRIEGAKILFRECYTYDEVGNRTSTTTCEGTSITVYNTRNEPIYHIDPLGNVTTYTYSYQGSFSKNMRDPEGVQTHTIYNARGHLVETHVKNRDGVVIQREEKKYDGAGNQTHAIEYVYENAFLKEIIQHEWSYGPKGRLERLLEAKTKETRYLYDAYGRLKTLIKPDGEQIHREYDGLSRLARYYGKDIDYHYVYDRKNRLVKVEDNMHGSCIERSYDIYDQLIKEKLDSGMTLSSQIDPYGNRTTLQLPDGSTAHYTYNGPYLYSVSRKNLTHTYSERNLAGKPTTIKLANQSEITLVYDPLLRWKRFNSPYFCADYTYDAVGNLTHYGFEDPLGKQSNHYSYDDLHQLLSENAHCYRYDSLYNRRGKDEDPYAINALCQITHDGKKSYTYDKNGNLLSDGEASYQYDVLDRLTSVTKGAQKTAFSYDAFNRRISKDNEIYIWDDKKEIGTVRRGKITELRILGEGLGAEFGAAVFLELNGISYLPIHDHRGSLVVLVAPKNSPSVYRYSAFGEQLAGDTLSPWRFASKRADKETGFIYFGRRYYSPDLGRWITADPLGFKDGPNLYAYVKNSPLLSIDLYGLRGQGAWESFKGGCAATFDYVWDGCRRFGSLIDSSVRRGFDTISHPIDHFRGMWDKGSDFIRQTPSEMNIESFRQGCMGVANSLFPKTTQLLNSSDETLDDYSRAYITTQATLETIFFIATLASAEIATADKITSSSKITSAQHVSSIERKGISLAGSRRAPLEYAPYQKKRNDPTTINGRKYTGHALDRMQDRGFMPSVIENTIDQGLVSPADFSGCLEYYDSVNKVRAIVGENGQIITIIPKGS